MNVIIHRGTNQIGGCVTEINTSTARIFIDVGSELPNENGIVPENKIIFPNDGDVIIL